jgi:hypothetical protein
VRRRAAAALAAPFLLLFAARLVASDRAVPAWGDAIGRHLASVVRAFPWIVPPPLPASRPQAAASAPVLPGRGGGGSFSPPGDATGPTIAVRVPALLVQRAIDEIGVHVRGKEAFGPGGEPIGVRLTGVTSLGLGLRDGDRVVAVEGEATRDEASVTDAALAAIARGAAELHVTALRSGDGDGGDPADGGGDERLVQITLDWPPPVLAAQPGAAKAR